MSLNVAPITHSEAFKNTEDGVWAINNSSGANERARGVLFISVKDGDRDVSIQIQPTWLPMNLLDYASAQALNNSVDLRNMVREQHVVLISPKSAQEILSGSAAHAEQNRMKERAASFPNASKANTGAMPKTIAIHTDAASTPVGPATVNEDAESPALKALVEEFNSNKIADEAAADSLRTMFRTGQISITHLQGVAASVKNSGSQFYNAMVDMISGEDMGSGSTSAQNFS